jgi:DNA-binding XRE family transcriptional regulator
VTDERAEFSKRLRYCRESSGMTREDLAKRLVVTVKSVYAWEAGAYMPKEWFSVVEAVGSSRQTFWSFAIESEATSAA